MRTIFFVLACTSFMAAAAPVSAQDSYPTKPIRLIVPFPAGGALDVLARPIAAGLGKRLGQNVLVENKPGGNLIPAAQLVGSAPPDGYTLFYTLGQPYSTNQYFYKSLPYDPIGYTPIAPIGVYTYTFQVAGNSTYKSLKEVVESAKKDPAAWRNANPGATSAGRLASELFMNGTGIKMTQVPYPGGAAQSLAVASGHVEFMVGEASSSSSFMRSGQVKTLAVNGSKRLTAVPDIPTLAEAGFPTVNIPNPYAVLVGPKGMPPSLAERLAREVAAVMQSEEVRKVMTTMVISPLSGGPAEAKALIDDEAKAFGPIIKALNLTLD